MASFRENFLSRRQCVRVYSRAFGTDIDRDDRGDTCVKIRFRNGGGGFAYIVPVAKPFWYGLSPPWC